MKISDLFRENIRNLSPYSTARDEYDGDIGIYLDANENPYDNGFNRYPDPHQRALKKRLSEIKGVPARNIFIGNGSDEPIDLVYRVFCEPRVHNVVSIAPTYGMYKVAAATNDVEFREVMLDNNYGLLADKLLAAADENTRMIFLCTPNNPTGNLLDRAEIDLLLERFSGLVVLDEAYIDFADTDSMILTLDKHPRLIVLHTLSKAWGMAGLRLGLAFASPEIIEILSRVKYPYNINVLTQQTVIRQLEHVTEVKANIEKIKRERSSVARALEKLPLIRKVYPSDANFLLVKVDRPKELYDYLIAREVIVRDRSRVEGCEGCLRITIGTPEENERLLAILNELNPPQ